MIDLPSLRALSRESYPGLLGLLVVALLTSGAIALGFMLPELAGLKLDRGIAVLTPPLLVTVLFLCWYNEKLWVYAAILSHVLFMVDSTPDSIGLGEVAFGAFGLMGLAIWFVKEMMVHRRRLVRTGFDLLLLSFMLVATITTLLANILNDGDLLQYLKEYGVVVDLLLYFPLRAVTTSRRDVMIIAALFIFVALVNGAISFLHYRERLAQAVFQWQVGASRSNLNESTSQALFVLGATIFAYAKRFWLKAIALPLAGAGLLFLLVSFSRSPIVAALLALMVMIALSPWSKARRVVIALALSLAVGAAVAFIAFPELASNLGQSIVARVVSVAETGSDRSFNARLVESSTALSNYFVYSPVIGLGFGTFFKFRDPISNTTVYGVFMHNGYVWSLYKLGIPLALLFYFMQLYPLIRLGIYAPRRHEGFNRGLMAAAAGYIVCALVVNVTSNLFTQVSTILNIVICWTLFDYIRRDAIERDGVIGAVHRGGTVTLPNAARADAPPQGAAAP